MRKLFFAIIVHCSLFIVHCSARGAEYNAALVADMDTGAVLYSEHANDLNYPASLTKIMTLYLTFDALEHGRLKLDDYLIVSNNAANASPVKLGLAAGSKIKVEDAIKAVAVHSANDVARVLAENLKGGKEGSFASLMTQVAGEIGLSKTNFENSSGLPDDDHLSSARDIALLSMAVYKHFPQYWKYFGIRSWTYNGQTYTNGNRLLGTYPGATGMKTGYTNKSKYSLVATAERDGHHLMSVVLGAANKDVRAAVSTKMLDKGFAQLGVAAAPQSKEYRVESREPKVDNSQISTLYSASEASNTLRATGAAGVQFGAFGSRTAAESQVARVRNALGVSAVIKQAPNGMFRVRAKGLSESAAQQIKTKCAATGIECFVFH
ncbi:MAG: D-alanyl-D-alanine carboxypeptidase [Rickettsiales bacterium]|jgi:D-alanyl-D-alanine carboxypeptidase|nr:D-alanyl-D-alanine carboxypeptidase [Rickettsiales bacterium]